MHPLRPPLLLLLMLVLLQPLEMLLFHSVTSEAVVATDLQIQFKEMLPLKYLNMDLYQSINPSINQNQGLPCINKGLPYINTGVVLSERIPLKCRFTNTLVPILSVLITHNV